MRSRREMLRINGYSDCFNNLDAHTLVLLEEYKTKRKIYRIFAEHQYLWITELTNPVSRRWRLGGESNKELINCYLCYALGHRWKALSDYSTLNKRLRYR